MIHRKLAVAALVAAPVLPLAIADGAVAAPAAVASTRHLSKHQEHLIAVANRTARHRAHLIAVANREARLAAARHAKILAGTARARVLAAARSALGRPYRYGAAGPAAFDCSGFTQWAYKAAGRRIARTTAGQAHAGRATRSPRPGDLLVYSGATHVALVYAVQAGRVVDTIVARHSGTTITHQRPYTGYTVRAVLA